jgi:hypothetical protein
MHHLGVPTPYEHAHGMLMVAYWPTLTRHTYIFMYGGVKFRRRVQKVTFGQNSMRLGPGHIAATTPNATLQSCTVDYNVLRLALLSGTSLVAYHAYIPTVDFHLIDHQRAQPPVTRSSKLAADSASRVVTPSGSAKVLFHL